MVTLQRILCAVEMRLDDINVLACACVMARTFRARVDTLLVREGHAPPTTAGSRAERPGDIDAGREAELLFAELLASTPGSPTPDTLLGGDAASILKRAADSSADLIVLGSRPPPVDVERVTTLAYELSRSAPCPVMTVPTPTRTVSLSRILLPVDFSAATGRAVEWTAAPAEQFSAHVHVLHAVGSSALRGATVRRGVSVRTSLTRAETKLAEIEQRLRTLGIKSESSIVEQGTTHAILACRQRLDSDLIVMGVHHHPSARDQSERGVAPGMVATIRCRATVPVLSMSTPESEDRFVLSDPMAANMGLTQSQALSAGSPHVAAEA